MLLTQDSDQELAKYLPQLVESLYAFIPSGLGQGGAIKLNHHEMEKVLERGAEWAVSSGYGQKEDLDFLEEGGKMAGADSTKVSPRAKARGKDQLGTLGSGNHFIEIEKVDQIFNQDVAQTFGLFPNQIVILIHTGSRGFGHQVCSDYINIALQAGPKYGIKLPDRELASVPFDSKEGQDFFQALACGLNFAWANRQVLTHMVRQIYERQIRGKTKTREIKILYDVAHNIAKKEEHWINGSDQDVKKELVLVHRKGATRSFGKNRAEVPEKYRSVGQPVIIPGSMGTGSYILVGTDQAMKESFGSTCHGAGRRMSRSEASRTGNGQQVIQELARKKIIVRAGSNKGIAEEAPSAYKNIDQVVEVVHQAGLAHKVARLTPVGVIKG
jgi:tRNA-splicing ligase RtcB